MPACCGSALIWHLRRSRSTKDPVRVQSSHVRRGTWNREWHTSRRGVCRSSRCFRSSPPLYPLILFSSTPRPTPMPASVRRALLGGATLLTLVASLPYAQTNPERPRVQRSADPNDWESYFDMGIELLQKDRGDQADAAFFWASRLRPDRAEPLFASWIAFWVRDRRNFDKFGDYLRDDERVLRDPQVQRADALRYAALRRNPFVHQGFIIYLYDRLPGQWKEDQLTAAWLALGRAQLPIALVRFGRIIAIDQTKYGYLRFVRASAFANSAQYDSAATQLSLLLTQLRGDDDKTLGSMYQSKELL